MLEKQGQKQNCHLQISSHSFFMATLGSNRMSKNSVSNLIMITFPFSWKIISPAGIDLCRFC